MAIKTLWNVRSAETGGAWVLDAFGGLKSGILYIQRSALSGAKSPFGATDSSGARTTGVAISGLTAGGATVALESDIPNNSYVAYKVTSDNSEGSLGLIQIDATFDDAAGGDDDFVTHPELDSAVSGINTTLDLKVTQGDVAKVNKGTVASSNAVSALAAGATLEQTVTKVNEVITTLNTVRSTAGAGITAANQTIDALTSGKVMKS